MLRMLQGHIFFSNSLSKFEIRKEMLTCPVNIPKALFPTLAIHLRVKDPPKDRMNLRGRYS